MEQPRSWCLTIRGINARLNHDNATVRLSGTSGRSTISLALTGVAILVPHSWICEACYNLLGDAGALHCMRFLF